MDNDRNPLFRNHRSGHCKRSTAYETQGRGRKRQNGFVVLILVCGSVEFSIWVLLPVSLASCEVWLPVSLASCESASLRIFSSSPPSALMAVPTQPQLVCRLMGNRSPRPVCQVRPRHCRSSSSSRSKIRVVSTKSVKNMALAGVPTKILSRELLGEDVGG